MTMNIGVILGSTRPNRVGKQVAEWVLAQARDRPGFHYELIDLRDWNLPLLDEPQPASSGEYEHEHTKRWAAKVASLDGFVFVTAEYNRSLPAALKNAIDFAWYEWNNKAAAMVGYGTVGGGRSVEHLRGISAEIEVADVRQELNFMLATDFVDSTEFAPGDHHAPLAEKMFTQLEAWTGAMKTLRDSSGD